MKRKLVYIITDGKIYQRKAGKIYLLSYYYIAVVELKLVFNMLTFEKKLRDDLICKL